MPSDEHPTRLKLRVGDETKMALPGLGSAGYEWIVEHIDDDGIADVAAADPIPQATGAVGASPDEAFTIRGLRPGVAQIRFAQRRPWEKVEPRADERILEVHITD